MVLKSKTIVLFRKSVRLGEYDTENDGPDCVEVEGGGDDCTEGAITFKINKIIVHPGYNSELEVLKANDIGLLKLDGTVPYNGNEY